MQSSGRATLSPSATPPIFVTLSFQLSIPIFRLFLLSLTLSFKAFYSLCPFPLSQQCSDAPAKIEFGALETQNNNPLTESLNEFFDSRVWKIPLTSLHCPSPFLISYTHSTKSVIGYDALGSDFVHLYPFPTYAHRAAVPCVSVNISVGGMLPLFCERSTFWLPSILLLRGMFAVSVFLCGCRTTENRVLMFDVFHGTAPGYLADLCSRCNDQRLRSSVRGDFTVPRTRTHFADGSFAVAVPAAWN